MFEVILVLVIIMLLIVGIYADYTMVKLIDERFSKLEKRIGLCENCTNHKEKKND